jgi:membrane protease YdiL (CAAX protease family)
MKNVINWKLFFVLLVASVIGSLMALPYTMTITSTPAYLVTPFVIFASVIQSIIQFSIVIFIGLYLAKKIEFGFPILESWLKGESVGSRLKSILLLSIGLGVLGSTLVIVFSLLYVPFPDLLRQSGVSVPLWQSFLAIFYGGIGEEILFRLFVMSLLVWISFKIKKTSTGTPTSIGIWLAIVISAVLFGLGHLPVASSYVTINTMTVTEAIVNNGIIGIVCGWLYWKKGLESAMIAHFSSDVVLHLIVPFVLLRIAQVN